MLIKKVDVALVQTALIAGNYKELLSGLRRIGRPIKHTWLKSLPSNASSGEKYKFTSNSRFKNFLVTELKDSEIIQPSAASQDIDHLKNTLSQLALFLMVWKDDLNLSSESEESVNNLSEAEKKRLRQRIKYKSSLDKDDRYAINIALQTIAYILCQQVDRLFPEQETSNTNNKTFNELGSKQELINFISYRIIKLNPSDQQTQEQEIKEQVEEIGQAISAFQIPNKKKKLIKYAGILLALIASLACGLSTGGAIFLLFPSLPILGIGLGALIGFWGVSANFGFFSQNFPDFLLSLLKKGGISEYIDQEGKRRQLSPIKKYLFIPLAILASLTVGVGTAAITYTTVLVLAAKLLPVLAVLWPPLPLIIVGILSIALGITLTVAVLTATIEAIKNSQNVTWANVKATINNLSVRQIVGYVFKGLLVLLGLFGLAYFRYTAGLDLSNLIGSSTGPLAGAIVAGITGVIAYIPQAFFTVFSIQKLVRVYSPTSDTVQEAAPAQPRTLFNRIKSSVSSVYTSICLIGNAFGNAALVVVDAVSALSISGAAGCFLNSWSGNLLETDSNQEHRNRATAVLAKEIAEFNGTIGDVSVFGASILATPRSQASSKHGEPGQEPKRPPSRLNRTQSAGHEYPDKKNNKSVNDAKKCNLISSANFHKLRGDKSTTGTGTINHLSKNTPQRLGS